MILTDVTPLAELNQLKTHILRMATHDLKNPLGRIMLQADLIEAEGLLETKAQIRLHDIQRATREMQEIIRGVLELEQLRTASAASATLARFDLSMLLVEVASQYESAMSERRQDFDLVLPPTPIMIVGSERQLAQAVGNLLSNAIKYSPEGGAISLRLYANPQIVRIEVQDTGYGIPQAAQAQLFTEFYRVKTEATANIEGTGLGLSLVKTVVDLHKGRVWFESVEGQGSTFLIELPRLTAAAAV
jgi:signal transduction histidine kinase